MKLREFFRLIAKATSKDEDSSEYLPISNPMCVLIPKSTHYFYRRLVRSKHLPTIRFHEFKYFLHLVHHEKRVGIPCGLRIWHMANLTRHEYHPPMSRLAVNNQL